MGNKVLVFGIFLILLVAWITGDGVPASGTVNSPSYAVQELPQAVPDWQQVNTNGFGDPVTAEVSALSAFNGYLYAGTFHPIDPALLFDGAQIFRSPDGLAWTPVTQPGFGDPHDTKPPAILDLTVFNSRLYASTGRGGSAGQIWRSLDGLVWAPMVNAGFGDPDTKDITALAVYNNVIYAGATNLNSGAQIWRSTTGDNNTWTQVAPDVPGTAAASVTGFGVYAGALYAAVESDAPAQIWRYDGVSWTTVVSDGFGDSSTTSTGGMAEFGGYLYVGAGNTAAGAQLWRSNNGTSWAQAIEPGFGDANNQKVETVFVFQNQLYVSVKNVVTGTEVWRSTNGTLWEQANQDGFGDSNNTGSNWSNATANFMTQLYVGTSNVVEGGELWRMQEQQATSTPTPTPTATSTATPTPTATSTATPTPTATSTATSTPTATSTATPTSTSTNTATSTSTATSTPTPTSTPVQPPEQLHLYLPVILCEP